MRAGSFSEWIDRIAAIGVLPSDTDQERLRKATLTLASVLITPLALVWVVTYWALGEPQGAAAPLIYQVVSLTNLIVFARTKRYRFFRFSQIFLMLLLPFAFQLALGGFVPSSGVIMWAVWAPFGALMFQGRRAAGRWLAAFLLLAVVAALLEPVLIPVSIPVGVIVAFFVLNIGGMAATTYALLQYFVRERERAQEESERLLLNVLPEPIARRLKSTTGVIADGFEEATVLFADIVDFTPMSERIAPAEVVVLLDEVFSAFDELAAGRGLEKIKTIGDAYMVAGGVPVPRRDHADAVADMALEMRDVCVRLGRSRGTPLAVRIGMDTGPVVAGVIGRSKFIYDLWGDAVNTASRMESHGVPGEIQVTARIYERLRERYEFRWRGMLEVKGKGAMEAYLLEGPKLGSSP
ncbi:MAG: adenylate/guanylate cyclase domain-containing protein [Actinomycetota bacterium]